MTRLTELFKDDYNFETLAIVAIALVAPILIAGTLLGFNFDVFAGTAVAGVEIVIFPLWLAANTIRDAGKVLEARLFPEGFGTTAHLRLRENSGYKVEARRDLLERVTGVKLLDHSTETARPEEADARIQDAVDRAKEKMRDASTFNILRRELKSYGFWRNSAAVKWWGVGIALVASLGSVVVLLLQPSILSVIALIASVAFCVYWLLAVHNNRVIVAAARYEDQFFKSLALI